MFGVSFFSPVINPPQVAILGVGEARQSIVLQDDKVVKKITLTLSLTFDHRVTDGAEAARFLNEIRTILEQEGVGHMGA